jgi:hypothetical protein
MTKGKKAKQRPLQIQRQEGESENDALARTMLNPHVQAGVSLSLLAQGPFPGVGLNELVEALEGTSGEIKKGDLDRLEETLVAHATVLDAIFNQLAGLAINNLGHHMNTVEIFMKLALRAQSQCRATIESVVSMKRPPELVKQTNIAHGHQQVINFPEKQNPPNELLEKTDGERLDPGTPQEAVRVDPDLATVGKQHRAKIKRR